MTEYNEGDTVRATKGFEKLEGVVTRVNGIPRFQSGFHQHFPGDLARSGYTLTVIEKAAPALPTEPGVYADKDGHLWILDRNLTWGDFTAMQLPPSTGYADPKRYAPFTRLEPVADTAKKVLGALRNAMEARDWATDHKSIGSAWDEVSKDFGVTE